jgi:uncharacterized membrane protein
MQNKGLNLNGVKLPPIRGILFAPIPQTLIMEKRVFGVILTVLGIAGLVMAAYQFVQGNTASNHSIRAVTMYGILGLIFFFAGIGLIRSTRDLSNRG